MNNSTVPQPDELQLFDSLHSTINEIGSIAVFIYYYLLVVLIYLSGGVNG